MGELIVLFLPWSWQNLLRDPTFTGSIPDGTPRDLFQELLEKIPEIVGEEIMAKPVDAISLFEAIERVQRHVAVTGFMGNVVREFPDDHPLFSGQSTKEDVARTLDESCRDLSNRVDRILSSLVELVLNVPTNRVELLEAMDVGLPLEAVEGIRAGTLTIGELFSMTPQAALLVVKRPEL